MDLAGSFDRRIVVEAAVPDAREIECAVLGNDEPEASVPGEVIPSREFYDYEAKYIDEGSQTIIPADLPAAVSEQIRRLSIEAFRAIDCAGMARVDFLLSRRDGTIFVNEVNTIPGFTTISMYSKMWAASGVSYSRAARSPDRAGARTSRREAAAAHQRHMSNRGRAALLVLCAVLGLQTAGRATPAPDLRGVEGLVRAYDFILEARFDQVEAELRRACRRRRARPATSSRRPRLWWRIQLDPDSRALDLEFSAAVERAIAATEAWAEREPEDAEAWFYLGGAYAARVQWRVLRDEKLAAARDGKRILHALERAARARSDPRRRVLRDGDVQGTTRTSPRRPRSSCASCCCCQAGTGRSASSRCCARGRAGGCCRGKPTTSCTSIYLWYEKQTARALHILEGLREQYPGNPLFLAEIARIQDAYLHDPTASLESWRALLAAAREQRANAPALAEARARLAIARLLDHLHQTDHAIEQLQAVIALRPRAPFGALPLAHLRLGEAQDRLGDRAAALQAYRAAAAVAPYPDVHAVRSTVNERTRRTPDAQHAEAYRLSLEGWRLLEKNDLEGAEAALERSLALHSGDPVAHYRMGRVLLRGSLRRDSAAGDRRTRRRSRSSRQPSAARAPAPHRFSAPRTSRRRVCTSAAGAASRRSPSTASPRRSSAPLADTRAAATRALTRLRAAETRTSTTLSGARRARPTASRSPNREIWRAFF